MKKFKYIIEGIVSPSSAVPGGPPGGPPNGPPSGPPSGPPNGPPNGPPSGPPNGPPGGPPSGPPNGPPVSGIPSPDGIPINDMLPDGEKIKPLPGSDVAGDEQTDKESETEVKRKAHEHEQEVEAGKSGKSTTKLAQMNIPEADYETILQDMFGSFAPRGSRTYNRGHRGNPSRMAMGSGVIPGMVSGKPVLGNIVVAVDTSGSITGTNPPMLETFLGAIFRITGEHEESLGTIRIIFYSDNVWHYIDYDAQAESKDPESIVDTVRKAIETGQSGGNDWGTVMKGMFGSGFKDKVNNEKVDFNNLEPTMEEFDGFIFLTDCVEANYKNSILPEAPTVFLIPTGGHDQNSESLPFLRWAKKKDSTIEFYSINLFKK